MVVVVLVVLVAMMAMMPVVPVMVMVVVVVMVVVRWGGKGHQNSIYHNSRSTAPWRRYW